MKIIKTIYYLFFPKKKYEDLRQSILNILWGFTLTKGEIVFPVHMRSSWLIDETYKANKGFYTKRQISRQITVLTVNGKINQIENPIRYSINTKEC